MRSIFLKASLALPIALLAGQGFSAEQKPVSPGQVPVAPEQEPVAPEQEPVSAEPTEKESQMIKNVLDKSVAVVVRVPLDDSNQQIIQGAQLKIIKSKPLQMTDDFDCQQLWTQGEGDEEMSEGEMTPRIFFLPFFRWNVFSEPSYIYDNSYYGNRYPSYNHYNHRYDYDRPSHHRRHGRHDYYYYNRRW